MTAFGKPQDEMIGSVAGENDGDETGAAVAQGNNSTVAAATGHIDHARIERAVREILLAWAKIQIARGCARHPRGLRECMPSYSPACTSILAGI